MVAESREWGGGEMSHLDDSARSDGGHSVPSPPVSEKTEGLGPSDQDVQRTRWFIFVLLVAFFLLLFIVFLPPGRLLLDPDLYWRIATGRKIWESGSLPQVDEFSHTFRGHPWIERDWLGDLSFFGAYSLLGWRGVAAITAGAIALAYALLFLMLARTMRLTVAIGVAAVALGLSVSHLHARTQIFSDGLMVVWAAALVRAVDTKSSPSLMLLLPVMTLWANVHGSFMAALALAVVLAAEAVLESPSGERLLVIRKWTVFLVAAVGAACITPYGARSFLSAFQVVVANESKAYINEWQAVSFNNGRLTILSVLALVFLALLNGVKIGFYRLTILLLITAYMLTAVRFIFLFNIIAPLLLATPLTRQFRFLRLSEQVATQPKFFTTISQLGRRGLHASYGVIAIIILATGVLDDSVKPSRQISPEGSVDYIFAHNLHGNIYNGYDFGGYLIFRGLPTFIDGRTEMLFGDGFITESRRIVFQRPREFIGYLDKYRISIGLVAPNSLESQEFRASSDWIGVYSDDISELFVKRN
jgi:hypothetical protein